MYRFGRGLSSGALKSSRIRIGGFSSSSSSLLANSNLLISNQNHYLKAFNSLSGNTLQSSSSFHTNLINSKSPFDDPRFEEFMRANSNFKQQQYRRPMDENLIGGRRTLLGTLGTLVWKIVTLPFKIATSILMFGLFFIGKMFFKRKIKEMEMMMARTTLRNVKPLNTLYRNDKFTQGQVFFQDVMTGQPIIVDEVLEDCLNFMDNNQLVYERLKEEAIKKSDSLKESFSISLHDSKEKVARDNGEVTKMCFNNSKFVRLVIDPLMMSARQEGPSVMVRRVPVFIMVKMSDKEIEQMKKAKPNPILGMNPEMFNDDNEILKEYKLNCPLYLDIHATYIHGEWREFKKLDVLMTGNQNEEGELLISFDELSSNEGSTFVNSGIMDAEFVEKK